MKKLLITVLLLGAGAYIGLKYLNNKKDLADIEPAQSSVINKLNPDSLNDQDKKVDSNSQNSNVSPTKKKPADQAPVKTSIPSTEQASIEHFVETLFINVNYDKGVKDVMEDLERMGLEPVDNKQANPYTGESHIIRTNKTLPGTRYFHAQIKGSAGNEFLQHMSFEIKPGPNAFKNGVELIKKQFKISGKPKIESDELMAWPVENGYIAWVKKLSKEDLEDNPFNAYTQNDVGTIRIAIEYDIHPEDDEHRDHDH